MTNRNSGSFTVEAAIAMPIFIFGIMLFIFLIQVLHCQDEVQWKLTSLARAASIEEATTRTNILKGAGALSSKIDYSYDKDSGNISITANYSILLPFPLMSINAVNMKQRVCTRAFIGVDSRAGGKEDDEIVYVTETGRVFHRDRECPYLYIKTSQVLFGDIENLRNASGAKYKPCECCIGKRSLGPNEKVYITDYGDRYHSKESCSKIHRTIIEMKKSQVGKRTPCSKCGEVEH